MKDLNQDGPCRDSALIMSLQRQGLGWICGEETGGRGDNLKAIQAGNVGGWTLSNGREKSGVDVRTQQR